MVFMSEKDVFVAPKNIRFLGKTTPKTQKTVLEKFWLYTYRRQNYSRSRIWAYFCHNRGQNRSKKSIYWDTLKIQNLGNLKQNAFFDHFSIGLS